MISPISIIHVKIKNNEGVKFIISKLLVFKKQITRLGALKSVTLSV